MKSILRAAFVSMALVGVAVLAMFLLRDKGSSIGFMGLRVVNDTQQTVRVQPCWDPACTNTIGLHEAVLHPGASKRVPNQWANNTPEEIVVGVLRPHAEAMHFSGCVVEFFPPGENVAVIRVSHQGVC